MSALTDRIFSLRRRGHQIFEIANVVGLTPAQVVARLKDPSLSDPSSGVGLLPEAPGGGSGGGVASRLRVEDVEITLPVGDTSLYAPSVKLGTIQLSPARYHIGVMAFAGGGSADQPDRTLGDLLVTATRENDDVVMYSGNPRPSWSFNTIQTIDPELPEDGGQWFVDVPGMGTTNDDPLFFPVGEVGPSGMVDAEPPDAVDIYLIGMYVDPDPVTWTLDFIEISVL